MNKSYLNSEKNSTLSSKPSTSIRLLLMVLFVCLFGNNVFGQSIGDYRSNGSVTFATATNWQIYNGSTWVSATNAPNVASYTTSNTITVLVGHSATISATATIVAQLTVLGTFTLNSGASLSIGSMYVDSSGNAVSVTAGSALTVNGNFTVKKGDMNVAGTVYIDGDFSTETGNVDVVGGGSMASSGSMMTQGNSTIFGIKVTCAGPCSVGSLCNFTGTISSNQTICSNATPATLTSTTTVSSPTYQWQSSTTSGGGFTDITPNGTNATYVFSSALTQTTYYRLKIKSTCTEIITNQIAIVVNPAPTAPTVVVTAPTCSSAATNILSTYSGSLTYTSTPTGLAVGAGGVITGGTTGTSYTIRATNASGCFATSVSFTYNGGPILPTPPAPTASAQSFCGSATVASLVGVAPTGSVVDWYAASTGGTALATGTALTTTTYYAQSRNTTTGCVSSTRTAVVVTISTTNTWTGATSASWFTPSNWSCGSVPTAASDVIIPNVTNKPIIDGTNTTALASTLTVNSGSLTVKSGNTLKVTDAVTNNSGTITFENSASLVQENDNAVNVGAIKYQRLTAPIRQTDYTYWSSPVKPIVGGGYLLGSIATSQNYLSYDSNITNDWKYENASTQMTNGFGYAIQGPSTMAGSPYLATFVGVPNNGNVQVPITYTNPSGLPSTDPDFGISYLLGNPYPSAIDADTFLYTNDGVLDGTLYFWTHNTEIGKGTTNLGSGAFAFTSNDYASYNSTGGVSGKGFAAESIGSSAIAKDIPTGKIAAGQGFFATGIASGTVNFINVMRISGTSLADGSGGNQQFFKTKNPKAKTAKIEKNRVWLNLSNTQGAFKQTLIGYVTGATNENDTRFDGQSFDGHEFIDFYSINDGKNLTIQGRALPFDENDEVPLGYRTTITGEFTINIDQVDGSLTNQPVFLEDKLTHTVTDLKSGNYTFNTNAGTFDNRFVLRYKDHSSDKTLGLDETDANDGIIVLYSNNYKTLIIRNNGEATINSVSLFNMTGQNLSVWDIKDWEQTSIQIPIKESSSGIYVVKVKTTMGESSKKIVIR